MRSLLAGTLSELWQWGNLDVNTTNNSKHYILALGGQPIRVLGLGIFHLDDRSWFLAPEDPYSFNNGKLEWKLTNCMFDGTKTLSYEFVFNAIFTQESRRNVAPLTRQNFIFSLSKAGDELIGVMLLRSLDPDNNFKKIEETIVTKIIRVWPAK